MTTEIAQPATLPILSHWIDGRPVEVLPEQTGPVYNPATGHVIGRVPRGGAAEVDAAGAVAKAAFPAISRRDSSQCSPMRVCPIPSMAIFCMGIFYQCCLSTTIQFF